MVTAPARSSVTRSPHASTSPFDVAERILMPKKFPVPPELSRGWYLDADGRRVAFQVGHVAKLVFARFSPEAVDEADPVPLDVIARELGRDDLAAIRRAPDLAMMMKSARASVSASQSRMAGSITRPPSVRRPRRRARRS